MASATDPQFSHLRASDPTGSDGAWSKDTSMPMPQPPPSPPVTDTETDTDLGPSSSRSPPHADVPDQNTDEPQMRSDATTLIEPEPIADTNPDTIASQPPSTKSTITSPPYWTARNSQAYSIDQPRTDSRASAGSSLPAGLGITLQDNESSSVDDRGGACWAKSVELTDYVTVNGSATNIGAFVVWNIRVETLNGSYMNIRKRYSEFDDFRSKLMQTFPGFEAAVPELPPKSVLSKFRPRFLEKRRSGLQYFLNCIMLNPEFSGSPVLKEFLFS